MERKRAMSYFTLISRNASGMIHNRALVPGTSSIVANPLQRAMSLAYQILKRDRVVKRVEIHLFDGIASDYRQPPLAAISTDDLPSSESQRDFYL